MNVSLTPKLEGFVKAKVKTGDYNNASEVIREAVRLLQERDTGRKVELAALRRSLRDGERSGPPVGWDPKAIKAAARRRARGKG
jgi:antitoxin ParD1/3/4